jgi:hypothetical protein
MKSFDILLVSVTSKLTNKKDELNYKKFDVGTKVLDFFAIDCTTALIFCLNFDSLLDILTNATSSSAMSL